ncbi:MAG TPA: DUF433 domain-containing protein [Acidobacteriaceae bacterium]
MDWSGCDLVEVVAGKRSGDPLIKGTRIPAYAILSNFETGSSVEEIAENYPSVPVETLRKVLMYAAERAAWDLPTLVDWKACDLVEQVPGRCSGAPTIVGTRIFPDTIAKYYWSGATVGEIEEDYPSLSKETILELIRYVKSQEARAA